MKRFAALLLAAVAAAPLRAAPVLVDAIVATVNGEPITLSDVHSVIRPHVDAALRAMPDERDPDAVFRVAFTNALAEVENTRLVVQTFRGSDMRLPEHALDRAAVERIEKQYGGDVHALQRDLARDGLTYSEWKDIVEEGLIVRMMRQIYVNGKVHVSPGDVARAWETNRAAYVSPARVHVAIAVFSAGDEAALDSFRSRLAAGGRFEELVAAPTDEERLLGAGDYGMVDPAAKLAPAFAKAVLALPDGGVSEPIDLGGWRFLLCRVGSEAREEPSLADTWERIEEDLWTKASESLYRSWLAGLRSGAAIREFLPEGLF